MSFRFTTASLFPQTLVLISPRLGTNTFHHPLKCASNSLVSPRAPTAPNSLSDMTTDYVLRVLIVSRLLFLDAF